MKSNYQPTKQEIFVDYQEVYKRINELKNFITIEILDKSNISRNNELDFLNQMSGKANISLINITHSNFIKIESISMILIQLLNYIETSSKYFEYEDIKISKNIKIIEGKKNNE